MTRVLYLLPLLIFLVLAEYLFVSLRPGHDVQELPSAMIEKPSPQFDLAGLGSDKTLALDALKGHPAVINFFASWCVPCRIEHPLLMRLAEQDHLPLYGVAYKDKPEEFRQAARDLRRSVSPGRHRPKWSRRAGFRGLRSSRNLCPGQRRPYSQTIRGPADRGCRGQGIAAAAQAVGSVMRWRSPFLVLGLLFLLTFALSAGAVEPRERLADPALEARARGISAQLRCLVCQNKINRQVRRRSGARYPCPAA